MSQLKSLLKKIIKSESPVDDFFSSIIGLVFRSSKLFISSKVYFKNQGELLINGQLFYGTFSNRIGLNPAGMGVLRVYKNGKLNINGLVRVARDAKLYVAGHLSIGNGTYINPNCLIFCRTKIDIGKNCAISWNCEIIDDDMHQITSENNHSSSESIVIGDRVWIGSNVKILKGITIGNDVIIAAGSIVTKDIPSNVLIAGIPAKIIKQNINWK